MQKIIATIEARMTSSRLPGKVLRPLAGKPMLQWLIERIRPARQIDEIVIATSRDESDDSIELFAARMGVSCFRGSLNDVLGRVTRCAESYHADLVVKLSGDNPLCHYKLIDAMVSNFTEFKCDFLGTTFMRFSPTWDVPVTFPLGFGVAIIPVKILQETERLAEAPDDRESVVKYIIDRPYKYKLGDFQAEEEFSALNRPELRLTVDTRKDFELMEYIFSSLSSKSWLFPIEEAIVFLDRHPQIRDINKDVKQKGFCKQ